MRVEEKKVNIDYTKTKAFFEHRADKFQKNNPYSVTMYQDNNKELVKNRNEHELKKLIPYLNFNKSSKILDIACGIGRWADAIPDEVFEYCGIDFSDELVEIAKERNRNKKFDFYVGSTKQIEYVLKENHKEKYNKILLIGIMMYLNDNDIEDMLKQIERRCDEHATICVREPVGIEKRLTLKDFYSKELADDYNAIYRTRDELNDFFKNSLLSKGFNIKQEGFLFDEDELNNRKETKQYYYIIER